MFCCALAALILGPLGLWAMPSAKMVGGQACCAGGRKLLAIGLIALAVASLCLAGFFLARTEPAYFRHICSVFTRP